MLVAPGRFVVARRLFCSHSPFCCIFVHESNFKKLNVKKKSNKAIPDVIVICLLNALIFSSCTNSSLKEAGKNATVDTSKTTVTNTNTPFEVTEKYIGIINGGQVIFEHSHFTQYRLTENNKVTTGALNTERGFGDDADATLFVLNPDSAEDKQKYFVRFTGGKFAMLNNQSQLIDYLTLHK